MNPLIKLSQLGQSYWIDDLSRDMLESGALERGIEQDGLRGVTSNPSIFHKAVTHSGAYDALIREQALAGARRAEIYERLVTGDVRDACDTLRTVYDETGGADGFVSLEVSPRLARDTDASIAEARRLFELVDRPNLMIKIPGTPEGLPAIEALLADGINVNITLLFSVKRYEAVADAWLRALERRVEEGRDVKGVASVASFFLSRIDVMVDRMLDHRIRADGGSCGEPHPSSLLGKAGLASARLAYRAFRRIERSDRWERLATLGARPQRLLWASTGTKNPEYSDVMYIEPLIGPHTVSTMPEKTGAAFADHGKTRRTLDKGSRDAFKAMRELKGSGIDMRHVATQLEIEGIRKFVDPYDDLLDAIEKKRMRYAAAGDTGALQEAANRLRRDVIRMTTAAGSGHPTSCMSAAEIVAALFFRQLRWDPADAYASDVDRFVLSKGHAAPILWAALAEAGAIKEDLLTLRRIDSSLEGHPTPTNPWVKMATGSLGQGLAAANGMALANRLDGIDARIYCLLGDGECSEGSVWEAAQFAALQKLDRVCAIVDENALGQSGPAPYGHNSGVFADRFRAFGWRAVQIDGHDLAAVLEALDDAAHHGPTAIIARTVKGKGFSEAEGRDGWHGKAFDDEQCERALAEIGPAEVRLRVEPRRVPRAESKPRGKSNGGVKPEYSKGDAVATRDGFGRALATLGSDPAIVALDGDVKNSTRTRLFAERYPERFFESYIAEQNMIGAALGLAACDKIPFATSFACFLSRAYDFVRMAGHSRPRHLVLCGSHAGISIGEDGPSQMGLEDLAMFRAVNGSTVLYPCDAVSAERLTEQAVRTNGIVYLRTTRPKTEVIYGNDEQFPVGGSKTLHASSKDRASIVAAGITVFEALKAHDWLLARGIPTRVIDAYSVKPIDAGTLERAARETGVLVVAEDHWIDGGLGDAVASVVGSSAVLRHLAVSDEPRSGSREDLLERYGISHIAIERAVNELAAA